MSFFYDLNKKLQQVLETPKSEHKQLNERDEGKPGKNFAKIAKDAGERYGSKAAGERVAGAVRNKLKAQGKLEERDQDFGPGSSGPNKNLAGPEYSFSPDTLNYKTPNLDKGRELDRDPHIAAWNKEKVNTTMGPDTRGNQADIGASRLDAQGQMKYINRTAPGVINKIKDKLGYDMPDPAYGPRPDERERLAKRYPKPANESGGPAPTPAKSTVDKSAATAGRTPPYMPSKPSKPEPKDNGMGRIVQGTWQADPKGTVPAPSGDPEGVKEAGAPMTAKQRSFAKLAPPTDKITFADKIAGAKKEVDEMLGDVAAEAMRKAVGGGRGRNAAMEEENAFDYKSPRQGAPKVGSVERGHKHDIKHTATGRIVTRRTDDQGHSVGADDESDADGAPRGRGRPKGTKNVSSKAKVFQRKSKLMTKEGDMDPADQGEYDQEGEMAKDDIKTIVRHAQALQKVLGDNDNLPEWVQAKLAKIEGMMTAVDDYMQNQASDEGEEAIAEKAVSKKQQRFMGMVHAAQKGEKPASKEVGKVAKTMKKKDAEDFAATKHKGLPEKAPKKKKEVEEGDDGRLISKSTGQGQTSTTSTTGRISATLDQGTVTVKPAKASNGMNFGKGIYDSMNRELEKMIAESMSVNMSDSTEGGKSLTITATDEDALKLGMLLKNAGLGGGGDMHDHGAEPCETCGSMDCGCGDVHQEVDENAPDWPTDTEQAENNFGYAGGLNKPKASGMATVPVTDVSVDGEDMFGKQLQRMQEMAGIKEDNIDLGPPSERVQKMSDKEVNDEFPSHIDLGPTSPEVAAMSNDEVNAALRSGMSPDISGMNPDEVNAALGLDSDLQEASHGVCSDCHKDPCQCDESVEESIRRMKEMAGIKEAKKQIDQNNDGKNDWEDVKIARMKASGAIKDKEEKKVEESIFTLTNQWKAYRG